jgi:DNA-binding CsgD family transcriptional regulator
MSEATRRGRGGHGNGKTAKAASARYREEPRRRRGEPGGEPAPRYDSSAHSVSLAMAERVLGMSVNEASELFHTLTERQRQVAELMAQGMTNRRIADELDISPKTLDIHRADVMDKLQVRTSAGIANIVHLVSLARAAAR